MKSYVLKWPLAEGGHGDVLLYHKKSMTQQAFQSCLIRATTKVHAMTRHDENFELSRLINVLCRTEGFFKLKPKFELGIEEIFAAQQEHSRRQQDAVFRSALPNRHPDTYEPLKIEEQRAYNFSIFAEGTEEEESNSFSYFDIVVKNFSPEVTEIVHDRTRTVPARMMFAVQEDLRNVYTEFFNRFKGLPEFQLNDDGTIRVIALRDETSGDTTYTAVVRTIKPLAEEDTGKPIIELVGMEQNSALVALIQKIIIGEELGKYVQAGDAYVISG